MDSSEAKAELIYSAFGAFKAEKECVPSVSLRGGDALDDYKVPPPFDEKLDKENDGYFEKYVWGIGYLDSMSWKHYLPGLIEYTVGHAAQGSEVGDALLNSLRPPDRIPPRLASLNEEQEGVIVALLDYLAFSEFSKHQALACLLLEEWWAPGALFRC
jgi:hypothetical protein